MEKKDPSSPKGKHEDSPSEADLDEQLLALADGFQDPEPDQSSEYADDNDSLDEATEVRRSKYADDDAKFRAGLAPYFAAKKHLLTQDHLRLLMNSGIKPLFVYGSKMFAPILRAVLGTTSEKICIDNMTPAYLDGYDRFCIKGSHHAAVLPHDLSRNKRPESVDGMLIFNLTDMGKDKIDEYEGISNGDPNSGIYRKILVHPKIKLAGDGGEVSVEAEMYVWACGTGYLKLQPSETVMWTPADFVLWQMELGKKAEKEATYGERALRSLNGKR